MLRSGLNHVALCADIELLITTRESGGFKCPDDKRAKAVWSFLTPLRRIAAPGPSQRYHE
ncbi:hypothetical protein AVEN_152013-1, partial [Araneus ventricosus]